MLQEYDEITIGFGNKSGQTNQVVLREKVKMLSLGNLGKTTIKKLEINSKNYTYVQAGILGDMIRKRRDPETLRDLVKVQVSSNYS